MVTCDNCSSEAAYTCSDSGLVPVNYCASCLPVWLQERANAGHFPLVTPVVEEAPKPSKKKAASTDESN